MLLALLSLVPAAWACQWESLDLEWSWTGDLTLTRDGVPSLIALDAGRFDAVRVSQEADGLQVRVTDGPVTAWGIAPTFFGLHPAKPMELGHGLRYGPQASVGVRPAKAGSVEVVFQPPPGSARLRARRAARAHGGLRRAHAHAGRHAGRRR